MSSASSPRSPQTCCRISPFARGLSLCCSPPATTRPSWTRSRASSREMASRCRPSSIPRARSPSPRPPRTPSPRNQQPRDPKLPRKRTRRKPHQSAPPTAGCSRAPISKRAGWAASHSTPSASPRWPRHRTSEFLRASRCHMAHSKRFWRTRPTPRPRRPSPIWPQPSPRLQTTESTASPPKSDSSKPPSAPASRPRMASWRS
mmetsp:Transcript_9471/g.25734  ORF Transcript_9471/g.25734 Transcript_9471/m.25734 type:complete len:203 (-) Transcript_9471:686-1294(-)